MAEPRLYIITDRKATVGRDLAEVIARALAAVPPGAAAVQVREKDLSTRALLGLTRALCDITSRHHCPLLINDRLDIALAVGADGVHLPEQGLAIPAARRVAGSRMLLGASTHGVAAAIAACHEGADLAVLGPIWPTPSKAAYGPPLGIPAIEATVAALSSPRFRLYALGGVTTAEHARIARRAGAYGVAAIRAILAVVDPGHAAASFHHALISGD